ncbi:MAG TPA: RNA pyrophosphohydrolase [Gammaproteobacteria bacterium]|nr:RNA pyrophosphohydrolase [Gammaproteobacteria bacterium]
MKDRVQVIDTEGYRSNVGIILCNPYGQLFWARRIGEDAWQFPQGGIQYNESPEQALYRELEEEVGLTADDVELLGCTHGWLRYQLPRYMRRHNRSNRFIGQKQIWFLLKLTASEGRVCLSASAEPEFDRWRWVSPEITVNEVIDFKRAVYLRALEELMPMINGPSLFIAHR